MSNDSAGRDEFQAWAESKGYDVAYTYDIDRSQHVWLNPMTADLWKAWNAALSRQSAQGAEPAAYRYRLHDQDPRMGWSYSTHLDEGEYPPLNVDPCVENLEPLYIAPPDTVPRAELEQYRKDAEIMQTALQKALDLLNQFSYEADEDSAAGYSYFKARIQEDSFFSDKWFIERAMQEGK